MIFRGLQLFFEIAVVITFSLGQLAQAVFVAYELYRLGGYYWMKLRAHDQDSSAGADNAVAIPVRAFFETC